MQGRYYFSPDETPFVRGWHIYGSRTWDGSRFEVQPEYGERRDKPMRWVPGELPNEVPNNLESDNCLGQPAILSDAIPFDDTADGFAPECIGLTAGVIRWHKFASYKLSIIQLLWSWVICELYENNTAQIIAVLQQLLDDDVVYTVKPRLMLLPRILLGICPRYAVVAVEGTTTGDQIIAEIYTAGIGPTNQGAYSTAPIFQACAQAVINALIAEGYVGGTPIFLCGHSLGGAAAACATAMIRIGNANTEIRFFTIGMPALGDNRLIALLESATGACLGNTLDPIPALPFGLGDVGYAIPFLGSAFVNSTLRWKRSPNQMLQHSNGLLDLRGIWVPSSPYILATLTALATNTPLGDLVAHSTVEYIRRIALRADSPRYPIFDPDIYAELLTCVPPVANGPAELGGVGLVAVGQQPFGDSRFWTGGPAAQFPQGTSWYFRMGASFTPAPLAQSKAAGIFHCRIAEGTDPIIYRISGMTGSNIEFIDFFAVNTLYPPAGDLFDTWEPAKGDPYDIDMRFLLYTDHLFLAIYWPAGDDLTATIVVEPA